LAPARQPGSCEEDHQLTTSLETAKGLPERAQKLIGFRSYEQPLGGRLGLVDYDDAARLLDGFRPV